MQAQRYMREHAIELLDRGFRIVPIRPGEKRPAGGDGWQIHDFETEIRNGQYAECGIGVLARDTPWIDVDVPDPELAEAFKQLLADRFDEAGSLAFRYGRAPKFAMPMCAEAPFKKQASRWFQRSADDELCRVEILADGQQAVAYATHPDTGEPYRWEEAELYELAPEQLPDIDSDIAAELVAAFEELALSMGFVDKNGSGKAIAHTTQSVSVPRDDPPPGAILRYRTRALVDIAEVYSALQSIDPDLEHDEWVKVGMALHFADDGAEGFELFRQWSAKGKTYDAEIIDRKWDSFGSERGITLKTLYGMAFAAGWDGSYVLDEAGRRFVHEQNRRRVADFNRRHGVTMLEGRAVVARRVYRHRLRRWVTEFSSMNDLRTLYGTQKLYKIERDDSGQYLLLEDGAVVDAWRHMRTRRTYQGGVEFRPVAGLLAGDDTLPAGDTLNLYLGLAVHPRDGSCDRVIQHIEQIWCSGNETWSTYVFNWLARVFQFPDEQGHTVIVLLSGEGAGKTIILDALLQAFGSHAISVTRNEDVTGQFNDHIATSVLVVLNEATFGGDRRSVGTLKALITDNTLGFNRKFLPMFTVKNCTHIVVTSNERWVAHVGLDDRRFMMLELSEARKGDREYFRQLAHEIDHGGLEAFVHWLMQRDVSDFDPRDIPETGGRRMEHKIRSADPFSRWWLYCLDSGEIAVDDRKADVFQLLSIGWDDGDIIIPTNELHAAYEHYVDRFERAPAEHVTTFAKRLREVPIGATQRRPRDGDKRTQCYVIPSLSKARDAWTTAFGEVEGWPEDETLTTLTKPET